MLVAEQKAKVDNTTEALIIPEIRKTESNIVLLYIVFNEIRKKTQFAIALKNHHNLQVRLGSDDVLFMCRT